jgi:hypothetical protein
MIPDDEFALLTMRLENLPAARPELGVFRICAAGFTGWLLTLKLLHSVAVAHERPDVLDAVTEQMVALRDAVSTMEAEAARDS